MDEASIDAMRLYDLRKILKENNLPSAGTRPELKARLLEFYKSQSSGAEGKNGTEKKEEEETPELARMSFSSSWSRRTGRTTQGRARSPSSQ